MAKINIEVETNPKSLIVSVDNEVIENVSDIFIMRDVNRDNEQVGLHCSISTTEFDQTQKVVKRTTFSTMGSIEAKQAIASGKGIKDDRFPDFVGYLNTVEDDITKFLSE